MPAPSFRSRPWAALLACAAAVLLGACAAGPGPLAAPGADAVHAAPVAGSVRAGPRGPAVDLPAGPPHDRRSWAQVYPALARTHLVVAIDRPGHGAVPATEAPRDPCTVADEQHRLLQRIGVPPPYVLVGHSLGGLYQYVHARLYPQEVAGLVLLDPTHPRHLETMERETPGLVRLVKLLRATVFSSTDRAEFDAQAACLERLDLRQPLGVPVRLLVSARRRPEERGDFEALLQGLRQDWLRLLGIQRMQTVWDAGHYIQQDSPEEVVAAVAGITGTAPALQAAAVTAGPGREITVGVTRRDEVRRLLGRASESHADGEQGEVWVFSDVLDVPLVVSLIPVLGDIADVVELLHKNRELIVQFDAAGVVRKVKTRELR